MVGLDNGRDCTRRGFGHGVATALYGALQLRLGEPPRADLRWDDHLRCGGRGCAIRAQPGGARRSTSRALVTGRWGAGALHKVLTVLPGVARPKRFELLTPRFVVWCTSIAWECTCFQIPC